MPPTCLAMHSTFVSTARFAEQLTCFIVFIVVCYFAGTPIIFKDTGIYIFSHLTLCKTQANSKQH